MAHVLPSAVLQYKGLAELQENYSSKGFDVLAFPCNQVREAPDVPFPWQLLRSALPRCHCQHIPLVLVRRKACS